MTDGRPSVDLGFLKLRNPVLTASGTFGYGLEFAPFMDLAGDRRDRRQGPLLRAARRESAAAAGRDGRPA